MWHGYFGVEDLNLSTAQRQVLIGELRSLGPASDPQPARLCHWRTRLDGQAAIFEALFNENNLTVERFKQRLGSIFSVDPEDIEHSLNVWQRVLKNGKMANNFNSNSVLPAGPQRASTLPAGSGWCSVGLSAAEGLGYCLW